MDEGIAEIERQQGYFVKKGWSYKRIKVLDLQKNVSCKSEVLADVAGGGWGAMPSPCQCHTTFFFSRPPNQLFKVTFMYFKYYIEPCSQFNSKFKPPIFSLLYLHQILICSMLTVDISHSP